MWSEDRVRIKDIAQELGLSTATVSNVLHGKTKKLSDRTVKAVQKKLEERNYIPNMAATLLAQNDSRIIGVAVHDHKKYEGHLLEDPFVAASLNDLADAIENANKFMMVKKAKSIMEIVRFATMWNLDGMVLIGFCEDDYQELRDRIRIPFVVYDGFFENQGRICNLCIDDRDGGRQVGSYFARLGHERVLCIADNHICMDRERYLGFCEGYEDQKDFSGKADFLEIPMLQAERRAFYEEKLELLLSYSAIFAVSDYYAADLMQFLAGKGIGVPEEISIAGFDDSAVCTQVTPALTSVRQDGKYRADTAIRLLRKMREDPEYFDTLRVPVSLVARDSTAMNIFHKKHS